MSFDPELPPHLEALYTSLREFGYLETFPIIVTADGEVVDGVYRVTLAALARQDLLLERDGLNEQEIRVRNLDSRIASLDPDAIRASARTVSAERADQIRAVSRIFMPWGR